MSEPAVVVDHVSKRYRLYRERQQSLKATVLRRTRARYEEFWALRDVSFEIDRGRTFGLIGENGSGKSTLLKCIAKILRPNDGRIVTDGKLAALLELGSGFHPELSGRENVYLNGSILGLSRRQIDAKFDEIVDFAGVERFIDQPVKNYSSGMYVRLGFSVAINVDPDILLVDEILAVGDAAFQTKCMEKFLDFRRQGKTVVVVSHAVGAMRAFCDEVAWLDEGQLAAVGRPDQVVDDYIDEGHAERETTDAGQTRWGSGEAKILKVELIGPDGAPTKRVRSRDEFLLRLHIEAVERIERPVLGLMIQTADGVFVWSQHSRDGGWVPDSIHGRGVVEYRVETLPLQPGAYVIEASINDYSTIHVFDYLRSACRFDVDHGAGSETAGIVAMNGMWHGQVTPSSGAAAV
jgi:ABC-2 type transport system ATP-binding protein